MSIFGDLDVTGVDDDPFAVKDGVYRVRCVDYKSDKKEDGTSTHEFKYKIEDPDAGMYNGRQVRAFFGMPDLNLYPAGTKIMDMNEGDQDKVIRLRRHIRTGYDVPEADITSFDPKSDAIGKILYAKVKTNPDKNDPNKKYVNIQDIESERSFDEKQADAAGSFGSDF